MAIKKGVKVIFTLCLSPIYVESNLHFTHNHVQYVATEMHLYFFLLPKTKETIPNKYMSLVFRYNSRFIYKQVPCCTNLNHIQFYENKYSHHSFDDSILGFFFSQPNEMRANPNRLHFIAHIETSNQINHKKNRKNKRCTRLYFRFSIDAIFMYYCGVQPCTMQCKYGMSFGIGF